MTTVNQLATPTLNQTWLRILKPGFFPEIFETSYLELRDQEDDPDWLARYAQVLAKSEQGRLVMLWTLNGEYQMTAVWGVVELHQYSERAQLLLSSWYIDNNYRSSEDGLRNLEQTFIEHLVGMLRAEQREKTEEQFLHVQFPHTLAPEQQRWYFNNLQGLGTEWPDTLGFRLHPKPI